MSRLMAVQLRNFSYRARGRFGAGIPAASVGASVFFARARAMRSNAVMRLHAPRPTAVEVAAGRRGAVDVFLSPLRGYTGEAIRER